MSENRRKFDDDHDLIIQIHTMLTNMKESYEKHVDEDSRHFSRLYKGQNMLRWYVAIGLGIVLTVEFFKTKMN